MKAKEAIEVIEHYSTVNEMAQDEMQKEFDIALTTIKKSLTELGELNKSDTSKEESSIYYFNEFKRVERELEKLRKRDTAMKVLIEEEPFYSIDNGDYIDNQPSMSIKVYKCPNCNNYIHKYNDYRYCYRCGQRLNWSDKE